MSVKKINVRKIFRITWFTLVAAFFIWNWWTFQSRNLPAEIFVNSEKVSVVESDDKISFVSKDVKHDLEVIFFQGGLTDPKAYAPLCRGIAEQGFTCHLIKMNFRLPQRDYKKINTLFDLRSGNYAIGGHSQGAKMAAQFVYENPGIMKALFLMGTSHPRDIDMSSLSIPAIKLYAEHDGLASVIEVMNNKSRLPAGTRLILVEGGNHSQFGYLGKLFTDDAATITLEEQQRMTLHHVVSFLKSFKK
jgi:hypothetical protein